MNRPVVFLSGADEDLQGIFNRFEEYREGLGVEFMLAVDAHMANVAAFPEIAPLYVDRVRRQVMHRYPIGILYEAHPTRILVVAVLDLRQDPAKIIRRLRR